MKPQLFIKEKDLLSKSLFTYDIEVSKDYLIENMLREIDKLGLQSFDVGTTEFRIQQNLSSCAKLYRKTKELKEIKEDDSENNNARILSKK